MSDLETLNATIREQTDYLLESLTVLIKVIAAAALVASPGDITRGDNTRAARKVLDDQLKKETRMAKEARLVREARLE